jgi:uncharacterized protein (DUF433 family)
MNERIIIDPGLQHGKTVIRGTRVPVTRILGGLAGGMTFDEICREYDVSTDDIRGQSSMPKNWLSRKHTIRSP